MQHLIFWTLSLHSKMSPCGGNTHTHAHTYTHRLMVGSSCLQRLTGLKLCHRNDLDTASTALVIYSLRPIDFEELTTAASTAAVEFFIVAPLFFLLGCWMYLLALKHQSLRENQWDSSVTTSLQGNMWTLYGAGAESVLRRHQIWSRV